MGKTHKRKKIKRLRRPPLSTLDKSIYYVCIFMSASVPLLLAFFLRVVRRSIAFNSEYTIAYKENASALLSVPFLSYFLLSSLIFFIVSLNEKKPIFGNKSIKYGEKPYREDYLPLFHKNNTKEPTHQIRKFPKKRIALWCAGLLITASLIPFSLFGRDVMYRDNSIERINVVNVAKATYTEDDFSHVTIRTDYKAQPHGCGYWTYECTITMHDSTRFTFSNRQFHGRTEDVTDMSLDKMLELKGLFASDHITIEGAKNTTKVADALHMNEQQRNKLTKLFS